MLCLSAVIIISAMNQHSQKKYSISKAFRWKPQQVLSKTFYRRQKTFFTPQQQEGHFRQTETFFKKRVIKESVTSVNKTPAKEEQQLVLKVTRKKTSDSLKHRVVRLQKSPYLSNSIEIDKMLRLLVPVKGPNQSLKLQIKRHNDMNIRNAQNLIMKRQQTFQDCMRAYSNRMGLPSDTKLFMMNSRDSHIKSVLLSRGWIESGDKQSVLFHLKWVYKDNISDYAMLQQGQFYNHFRNNQELTNKNYLRKNIKKQCPQKRPSFPYSFDLQLNDDYSCFQQAYSQYQAYKFMNTLGNLVGNRNAKLARKVNQNRMYFQYPNNPLSKNIEKNRQEQSLLYSKAVSQLKAEKGLWEILTNLFQTICYMAQQVGRERGIIYSIFTSQKQSNDQIRMMKKLQQELFFGRMDFLDYLSPFYQVEIIKIWKHVQAQVGRSYGFDNMWILKPTGVSRGSGIQITNQFTKVVQMRYGKIVQKYIEYPFLLDCKRKFDIRQWILVTSVSPLKAYAFRQCYGRFSSIKYSNDKYENMQKHLTNYSQNKDIYLRQKMQIKDNISAQQAHTLASLPSAMSEDELASKIGPKWQEIKLQMFADILKTLNCCSAEITQRQKCFQVFGFDIILDQSLKPYILQVNMSPACENRQFLGSYLTQMAEGIVDMLEGKEPTGWIPLERYQKLWTLKKLNQLKVKFANRIQKWWRRRKSLKVAVSEV